MAIESNADVAREVRASAAREQITYADLARELRISRMAMSRRMRGETPFTPEELIKVARKLRIPVVTFFTGSPASSALQAEIDEDISVATAA